MPDVQVQMNANPLKKGILTENSAGIGAVTDDMVRERAVELAQINSHSVQDVSEDILCRCYEDLYRFAFSLARNRDEACHLTQQTYAIYAEKGRQVRDASKVKSWFFTTLYREFLRLREHGRRFASMDDENTNVPEQVAASDTERSAEHGELLDILDDGHREIPTVFHLQRHACKDIAEILEMPIGTVMSRLSRAKDALREKLDVAMRCMCRVVGLVLDGDADVSAKGGIGIRARL